MGVFTIDRYYQIDEAVPVLRNRRHKEYKK